MRVIHVREVANVAATLVEGLNRLGHQAELRRLRIAGGWYPLPIKALFLPHRILEGMAANRYIKRHRFDIVHIHMAYMGWLGILGRYPYFLHCHGHDLRRNLYHPLLRWLTRRALARAYRVYYSTPDLAFDAAWARPDAVFLPNPINIDRFQPGPNDQPGDPRLLLISRLWDIKGVDTAFGIIREVKQRYPSASIHAFAWGPERRRFRDNRDVSFIPFVPYSEMPDLISRYDIVVGQFVVGSLGMSELESMACGKPVVSYFCYPEVYDEPPPVFSAQDVAGAVEHLAALLENPSLRRQAGEKGREWVLQHHHYLKIARMVEQDYQSFLSSI